MSYYDNQESVANIYVGLVERGWNCYGYKADDSDMMTDYWSPARWDGIAEKNGFVLLVDVYSTSQSGYKKTKQDYTPDYDKISKLKATINDKAASSNEKEASQKIIDSMMNKQKESTVIVSEYPTFYNANPKGCNWHIEKDGNIIAKGKGAFQCDGYLFGNYREETLKKVFAFIDKIESKIAGSEQLEAVQEKVIKKVIKPVEVTDRKTVQIGDILTFEYHEHFWYVNAVSEKTFSYELLGSEKRGYQRTKNGKRYYDYMTKFNSNIENGKIKIYELKELEEVTYKTVYKKTSRKGQESNLLNGETVEAPTTEIKENKQTIEQTEALSNRLNKSNVKPLRLFKSNNSDSILLECLNTNINNPEPFYFIINSKGESFGKGYNYPLNEYSLIETYDNESIETEQTETQPEPQTAQISYQTGTGNKGNGIEISFTEKPSEEVRNLIKSNGYRWGGKQRQNIWWAILSDETEAIAKQLTGENNTTNEPIESTFSYPEIEIDDNDKYTIPQNIQDAEHDGHWLFRSEKKDHNAMLKDYFTQLTNEVKQIITTTENEYIIYKLKKTLQYFKKHYHQNYLSRLSNKASNPSWIVTGRAGRNSSRDAKFNSRYDKLMQEYIDLENDYKSRIDMLKNKIRNDKKQQLRNTIENTNVNIEFTTVTKEFMYMGYNEKKRVYAYGEYFICKLWNCFRLFHNDKEININLKTTDTLETAKKALTMYIQQKEEIAS